MNRKRSDKNKLPEEMLTETEINRLIDAATGPKFKAFVSMLYETGCRISELIFMQIRNIRFDKYGAIINVPPVKTGQRRIRIVSSVPLLTEWMNVHPDKNNPAAYLWPSNQKKIISYGGVYSILEKIAKKAGVKKRVNPHNFRHSRATYLANYLTEAQMKEYFGWYQDSDMASIYVHLSGRDVDNAILGVYGIKNDEKPEKSVLSPKSCTRCKTDNPATNKFCSLCGMPLDTETANKIIQNEVDMGKASSMLDELIKDPEFREIFVSKAMGYMKK